MLPRDGADPRPTDRAEDIDDAVMHFVVAFVRVIRTLQLYPSDHRFVSEGFGELVRHLGTILGVRDRVTFGFRDDAVLFEDRVLLRGHPTVASLRHYFEEKNIESFTIDREVALHELRSLADVLARHRQDVMKDGGVEERFLGGLRSIRLNEVSYRRVATDEPPGPARAEPPPNPFLHLEEPARRRGLATLIADDPTALSSSLADLLRDSIAGFSRPDENVDREFLEVLERIGLAVLEDPDADFALMRSRLGDLLRPLGPHLVNRGLRRLVVEKMGHEVTGTLPRFSVRARARILLTDVRRHRNDSGRLRKTLEALSPGGDQAEDVIASARAALRLTGLDPREQLSISAALDEITRTGTAQDRDLAVLADRNARTAGVTRLLLERVGFDVVVCTDGTTTLETILSARPALVVLDPELSGTHGLEVLARLKRVRPCVPVVFASPHASFRTDYAVSTYPRLRFLAKPYERSDLIAAIRELQQEQVDGSGPLGPESVFEHTPVGGPTFGLLRTTALEVGVCARGRFRDVFFRVIPVDEERSGILVAEREAGPVEAVGAFRAIGRVLAADSPDQSPAERLRSANRAIRRAGCEGVLLSALALEMDGGFLSATRAGYDTPLVATPGGAPAELHLPFGPLLGAAHAGDFDSKLRVTRVPFPSGAVVLLASTGAAAAIGGEDAELSGRLLKQFMAQHSASPLPVAMEALMDLLNGLGVRGPGRDMQVLIVRRR